MKTEIELDDNFVSDLVAKELQELYEFTGEDWFDEDPEEAREALSTVLFYYMNPTEYRKWSNQKRNLAAEVVEGFDHLEKDEVGMIECGTCGYPLLPEERTSLVERNGKMVKPELTYDSETGEPLIDGYPMYSGLPKREWVGLTQEELQDLCVKSYNTDNAGETHFNRGYFADAIESKLKEKNT